MDSRVGLDEQATCTERRPLWSVSRPAVGSSSRCFFALLFGALLAAVVGLYIYKQQNPDYDPWEEPWENSSSPVDLGLAKEAATETPAVEAEEAEAEETPEEA